MPSDPRGSAAKGLHDLLADLGKRVTDVPVRQESAKGQPPPREFLRRCTQCAADFVGLAAGKTGVRGLWDDSGRWWCSVECYDHDHSEAPYVG